MKNTPAELGWISNFSVCMEKPRFLLPKPHRQIPNQNEYNDSYLAHRGCLFTVYSRSLSTHQGARDPSFLPGPSIHCYLSIFQGHMCMINMWDQQHLMKTISKSPAGFEVTTKLQKAQRLNFSSKCLEATCQTEYLVHIAGHGGCLLIHMCCLEIASPRIDAIPFRPHTWPGDDPYKILCSTRIFSKSN